MPQRVTLKPKVRLIGIVPPNNFSLPVLSVLLINLENAVTMKSIQKLKRLTLGALLSAMGLQAATPTIIPADFAYPLTTVSEANRGFAVRVKQATTTAGELVNSTARTEAQLAGTLVNRVTGLPYENIIDLAAATFVNGVYTETTAINYEQGGSTGLSFPGIPGTESHTDNIAMEVLTWLELPTGTHSMIVNSDDGFRVTVGKESRDQTTAIELGKYEGGRGAGDSIFNFTVTQSGIYSFRLIYQEGGGGANCSWFTAPVGNPEARVLVNDAAGIKAYNKINAATPAYVSVLLPPVGSSDVSPGIVFKATLNNGSASQIPVSSVKLTFDGASVAAAVTAAGGAVEVSYDPPGLLEPGSKHTVVLEYLDGSTARKLDYSFTSSSTGNLVLPTPIWIEKFESTAEGAVPTGWTLQNYSGDPSGGDPDFNNPNNDVYLDWVVIPKSRVLSASWDAGRRLNVNEQFVNGQLVTSLVDGNFLYAESDNRGGSQVQYAFSPDQNLTGKTNIYLSFHSIYEQNQDNIGAVEYSIDKGATWLPILYMLDGPDIKLGEDGKPDGYATMTAANPDTAVDPNGGVDANGEPVRTYGAFIGVATNQWPNIGSFISARLNDNPNESKRIELFRLPKADGQATVRLRFAQAGTGSWYFGIDNVGLYSINTIAKPVIASASGGLSLIAGSRATFTVDARGEQLSYQWQLNSNSIPNATNNSYVIPVTKVSDSGNYRVVVTNPGGQLFSADASLLVSSPLSDPTALSKGLVAYLPFDGNYSDVKGNVTATAKGAPTFEAGKRGQGIHVKNLKDGSLNNYVSLGYPNALKFGDSKDFTVSFWVKLISQADDQAFISNKDWNSSNNRGWGIFSQGGALTRVNFTGPASSDKFSQKPPANLPDGQWHLITVAVARTGTVDSYVDGTLSLSVPIVTKGNIDTDDLGFAVNLGQDGTGKYTDGGAAELDAVLDEVAVWDRALNAQEAMAIYSLGSVGESIIVPALTQNLEVYLPFDGNYSDKSGKGVVAAAVGAPDFQAGSIGQGIHVNNKKDGSVNNYVTLGYPQGLKFGETGSFSVSFWVKLNGQADDQAFISNKDWNSSNNRGWGIFSQGGGVIRNQFTGPVAGDKYSQKPALGLNDAQWHLVSVSVDRATGKSDTYLDGSLNHTSPLATKGSFDTDDLSFAVNIGQDGTGKYTDGGAAEIDAVIDDLAIWSRPLIGVEVAGIYSKALGGKGLLDSATPPVLGPSLAPVPAGLTALTGAILDAATKTITVDLPANGAQGYLAIKPSVTILSTKIVGGKLVIKYQ